jgi:hypothetical protein
MPGSSLAPVKRLASASRAQQVKKAASIWLGSAPLYLEHTVRLELVRDSDGV